MNNKDLARELVALAGKLVEGGVTGQHLQAIREKYEDATVASAEILQGAGVDFETAVEMLGPVESAVTKALNGLRR